MKFRILMTTTIGAIVLVATTPIATPASAIAPGDPVGCTITGTPGPDRLIGTPGPDVICGLGGNDLIIGYGGADTLIGGAGNDRITGGAGADVLLGGTGRDLLVGGAQPDQLIGGAGVDQVTAGTPGDTCAVDAIDPVTGACGSDTSAPVVSIVDAPSAVNAGDAVTVSWRVTDASGVDVAGYGSDTHMLVGGPSGWTDWCASSAAPVRTSGTSRDGVYQASCTVPATAPNATYSVFFFATDVFGNYFAYWGLSADFAVQHGSDDTEVPVVSDATVDATTLHRGDAVTVTFRATDATGVEFAMPEAWGPGGRVADDAGTPYLEQAPATLVSGDARDGVYSVTLHVSSTAALGSYDLWYFVRDVLGNKGEVFAGNSFTVVA